MKHTEAIQRLTTPGSTLAILAEYRGGKAEVRQFRGADGRQQYMSGATHRLEVGDLSLEWGELLDDRVDVQKWVAPAPKGTLVLVEFELSPTKTRGQVRPRVKAIHPIDNTSK